MRQASLIKSEFEAAHLRFHRLVKSDIQSIANAQIAVSQSFAVLDVEFDSHRLRSAGMQV